MELTRTNFTGQLSLEKTTRRILDRMEAGCQFTSDMLRDAVIDHIKCHSKEVPKPHNDTLLRTLRNIVDDYGHRRFRCINNKKSIYEKLY